MVYTRNQPVASDDLDVSQPFLVNNNNGADDSFGIDHYKFSDLTANNGFHNKVTTPAYVATPPTGLAPVTITAPIFYSFQDLAAIGVIQYSRGPSNAVPTPVTSLQSSSVAFPMAPSTSVNILNFSGLTAAICNVYAFGTNTLATITSATATVYWNGTTMSVSTQTGGLQFGASGSTLVLVTSPATTLTDVRWTLNFERIN